ncbi:RHS repeat protein [Streptomyces sp. NBC_01187]|nr:RHS repeat protein [Streptomyces sp. NBC_01187]
MGRTATLSYDEAGRVATVTRPDASTATLIRDEPGRPTVTSDPRGLAPAPNLCPQSARRHRRPRTRAQVRAEPEGPAQGTVRQGRRERRTRSRAAQGAPGPATGPPGHRRACHPARPLPPEGLPDADSRRGTAGGGQQ